MAEDRSTFQVFQKQDSEGFSFNVGKDTLENGEVIEYAPPFRQIKNTLDNLADYEVRSDDVWLITYPKAGTHWVFEIIHMLMHGTPKLAETRKELSMLEANGLMGIDINRLPSPRILNSHMRIKYLKPHLSKGQKIVHVVRNPKSIAVSYFYHTKKIEDYGYSGTFHSYLPTFLQGYDTACGNWFEYMHEWWDFAKGNKNVYFVFYEELKKEPEKEVRKLATFLGFDRDDEFISKIVNLTSFDAMKNKGGKQSHDQSISSKEVRDVQQFLRKGTIQDWKNHFTVAENEMFDELFKKEMSNYKELKERVIFQ